VARKKSTVEDKALRPAQDKAAPRPEVIELVKIRFRQGRAAAGIGVPGQIVSVHRHLADHYVAQGYAEYVQ
jgi:hypothetical protein